MRTSHERPLQFRIGHLLAATGAICLFAAIGAQLGWRIAVLVVLLLLSTAAACFRRTRTAGIAAGLFLVAFSCLWPAVSTPRSHSRRASCTMNLNQIGMALHVYHMRWGCFPPAYVKDESGAATHSWRTLILPELGQDGLYAQFDISEPWNSAKNVSVANTPLREYRCPADKAAGAFETNYFAVVGPGTAWPGDTGAKLSEFRDGTANTILLVEVVNYGIRWAEPRDLHILQMPMLLNAVRGPGPSSNHEHINVLFADGHIMSLSEDTSPEELRALLTINGGEPAPPE
jgi:prepilin-type processing-associated H-X9-DG protein